MIKLKILIIGKSGVGKSCVLQSFTTKTFDETHSVTVGMDFKIQKVEINGESIALGIWDTAGLDSFKALTPSFYRDAHGAILVYDVTDPSSLASLYEWVKDLYAYSNRNNLVGLVLGNKIDQPRVVRTEEGEEFAKRQRMMYLESSARTMEGIDAAFEELTRKILDTPGLWEYDKGSISNLEQPQPAQSGYCCR